MNNLYKYCIECFFGFFIGWLLGITGIQATGLLLIVFEIFKIGNFKSNLGSLLLLNLFPITIGSIYEFYKTDNINYGLSIILMITVTFGSYMGSKYALKIDNKNIKLITSILGFIIGFVFLYSYII